MAKIINPLSISKASALEEGPLAQEGEVRHFGLTDEMEAGAISTPTRQLAHRDNLIADKLNEVVALINNREQFTSIPVPRTVLPSATTETVFNYRIPPGFEARIVNASVSSNPTGSGRMEIFHNASRFGDTSGVSLVTTGGEFVAGTTFKTSGEFIVQLTNSGGLAATLTASVIVSIRPTGSQASSLIEAGPDSTNTSFGTKGDTGDKGDQGDVGPPGAQGATFQGVYNSAQGYFKNDVVRYLSGIGFSSYIARAIVPLNQPPPFLPTVSNSYWDMMAQAGSSGTNGAQGAAGPQGSPGINGANGANGSNGVSGTNGINGADGQGVVFTQVTASGSYFAVAAASSSSTGSNSWDYIAFNPGVSAASLPFYLATSAKQVFGTVPNRILQIQSLNFFAFCGTMSVTLPGVATGGIIDWTTNQIDCEVRQGWQGFASLPTYVTATGSNVYTIVATGTNPGLLKVFLTGFAAV